MFSVALLRISLAGFSSININSFEILSFSLFFQKLSLVINLKRGVKNIFVLSNQFQFLFIMIEYFKFF